MKQQQQQQQQKRLYFDSVSLDSTELTTFIPFKSTYMGLFNLFLFIPYPEQVTAD